MMILMMLVGFNVVVEIVGRVLVMLVLLLNSIGVGVVCGVDVSVVLEVFL